MNEEIIKELKRIPILRDDKPNTLAGFIGYLLGEELYKNMTDGEIEKFIEALKNETKKNSKNLLG